jgi:hypothetical protein
MTMAGIRFADMRFRPAAFLDFTSLTGEEFEILIPPFEAAFQAHMTRWCLDGTPRTNRRFSVYRTCPLAAPEDRLFFLLTYLKTYTLQVVQGRLFGMGQSKANQWIHVLLPALLAALRDLGDAPTRCLTALARRLDVPDAATGVVAVSAEEPPAAASPSAVPVAGSLSPLLPMTGRNGALSAPKTLLNKANVTVARKRITQ